MHCKENPVYVFLFWELRGLSPNFPYMCLWAFYIFPGSVHLFTCCRVGKSIVGIYESLTDTWMWKLGLWPSNSFSGNSCFEFSLLFLCSLETKGKSLLYFNRSFVYISYTKVTNHHSETTRAHINRSKLGQKPNLRHLLYVFYYLFKVKRKEAKKSGLRDSSAQSCWEENWKHFLTFHLYIRVLLSLFDRKGNCQKSIFLSE